MKHGNVNDGVDCCLKVVCIVLKFEPERHFKNGG